MVTGMGGTVLLHQEVKGGGGGRGQGRKINNLERMEQGESRGQGNSRSRGGGRGHTMKGQAPIPGRGYSLGVAGKKNEKRQL